tara:strand:+ start:403 stop:1005 length:603 start_codon:yes stop_codon:yes gene_type:complete
MKNLIKILLLMIPFNGNTQSDYIDDYYNEICYNTEFAGELEKPYIFKKDVYIYVVGDNKPDYLMKELYKVVDELNDLIESVEIYITNDRNKENALVYFGDPDEYVKYMNKPHRRDFLKSNWGAAWLSTYDDEIRSVDIFINTNRSNELLRRHLLREELTQSLGFPNDSNEWENSIFYAPWSDVTEFSDLDKLIIKRHYKN